MEMGTETETKIAMTMIQVSQQLTMMAMVSAAVQETVMTVTPQSMGLTLTMMASLRALVTAMTTPL